MDRSGEGEAAGDGVTFVAGPAEPGAAGDALAAFHPAIAAWFRERLGAPTVPQALGWPEVRAGRHVLIAAPTGSGKTLAAFLAGIDALLREGAELPRATRILYVSPLRALSNDVQKNLSAPLAELRARDPSLPEVRVLVRTGDTPQHQRQAMTKRPPHILVTTPESLGILLTSDGGRALLGGVRTVIVDEIHALARDKRGAHLALCLERLEALAGPVQRLGLSATQRPIEDVARFLVGVGRPCAVVDAGHVRERDLEVVVPASPLAAVCSHETWGEIYAQIAQLIREHTTTLVFVNTRTLAERVSARLAEALGPEAVCSHHGSLSRELRLAAEQRLKAGQLKALVATASLELGIDIGDVDLVVQVGSSRSIATLLQRVGRSGHALGKTPKGRLFPLTRDELVEAAAALRAVRRGELDRIVMPRAPLDILAQQVVAECVARPWEVAPLHARLRRAWPYRDLPREDFDAAWALHTHSGRPDPAPAAAGDGAAPAGHDGPAPAAAGDGAAPAGHDGPAPARPTLARGRAALLHHDAAEGRLRATRRARLVATSSGGAIPDTADYQVLAEPEGTQVGTLNEDFAIESHAGDIFQLGNTSWRILRVEPGVVRVADAGGAPPTIPFWLGEAPARTAELASEVSRLREAVAEAARAPGPEGAPGGAPAAVVWLEREAGLRAAAAEQVVEYVLGAAKALGVVPTQERLVLERFFDESGGMQLVLHAPFGGRVNRALGLALRKRFCVGFGFELQAAANEEAIILSLGPQHSFPLEDVFDYVKPATAIKVLTQALLAAPMFETRWRWNATRSLLVERMRGGKRVPPPLVRMRAGDLLTAAFPQATACPETLPPGPIDVPLDHPLVRQTVEDCLTEAMDKDGFVEVLRRLQDGRIARVAVDVPEPSPFAQGILTAQPYTFLDDAPLEERRTHAVLARRGLDRRGQDGLGALDPAAIAQVREEAWPQPASAEEVHEALSWIGYVTAREAAPWAAWLAELEARGRARREVGPIVAAPGAPEDGTTGPRWVAGGAGPDPLDALRGRLEALGPVVSADPRLLELEREGTALRVRFDGRDGWCHRRLLARIQRGTIDRLRREIEPVSAADFLRFLGRWQRVEGEHRLEGPRGLAEVLRQLAGFEVPAVEWERSVLPARVKGYRRDWLDQLTLSGEVAWGRLWGEPEGGPGATTPGASGIRGAPLCLVPRDELDLWTALAGPARLEALAAPGDAASPAAGRPGPGDAVRRLVALLEARGAQFQDDLGRALGLAPPDLDEALGEAVARGLVTCDGYGAVRGLVVPASRRAAPTRTFGRWSRFRGEAPGAGAEDGAGGGAAGADASAGPSVVEVVARTLLRRWGVVFKRLTTRERLPVPWRELCRCYRLLEMRGELRGGRFVAGFSGEQWALPEAVEQLRATRRAPPGEPVTVSAADPLNLRGIVTPDERVARSSRRRVLVG